MDVELRCSVINVEESHISGAKILTMDCGKAFIKMDIHKDLNPVEKGDIVNVSIHKSMPSYVKGVDFLAHGYVITKRKQEDTTKIYISLWGYLVVILTSDTDIINEFNPLDKVYIKLWK